MRRLIAVIVILLLSASETEVFASALMDDLNYSQIEDEMDKREETADIEFGSIVSELIESGDSGLGKSVFDKIFNNITDAIKRNLRIVKLIMSLVISLAVFRSISEVFKNGLISETGYYAAYIIMFGSISVTLYEAGLIAKEVIGTCIDFMKVLLPVYSTAVTVSTGSLTSTFIYELILMVITVCEYILLKFMIPVINLYLLIMLAGNINKENRVSKLGELIETVVNWTQKSVLGVVLGIGAIKGLLTPAIDGIKRNSAFKLASAIPGVGNAISTVTETVLGAASLIKNAVGIAGIIVLLMICSVPLIKLLIYYAGYRIGAAVIQPTSDSRVTECINSASNAAMMLVKTVFSCIVLFILALAVSIAGAT